jgi:hypothetical protein
MVAAGNVQKKEELAQIVELSFSSIDGYLADIEEFNFAGGRDEILAAQNRYAYYQKQNPHTPRTMTSLGLDEEEVKLFINECLFPETD